MHRLVAALFVAFLFVGRPAHAEELKPGSPNWPLAERLIALDKSTWELYSHGRLAELGDVTAPDYNDIYPDGRVIDRATYLADAPDVKVDSYELSDFHVFQLTDESVIITYRARVEGTVPSAGHIRSEVQVTSAWALRDGKWLNVFYRESVVEFNGKRLLPPAD